MSRKPPSCVSFGKARTFTDLLCMHLCRKQTCQDYIRVTIIGKWRERRHFERLRKRKSLRLLFSSPGCHNLGAFGKCEERGRLKLSVARVIENKETGTKLKKLEHFTDGLDWSSKYEPGKEKQRAGSKGISHSSFCWEEAHWSCYSAAFFSSSMYCLYKVY